MNQREITLFLAFYLYLLNTAAANDAHRIVLLSFVTQIRAQILMLKLMAISKQLPCPVPILRRCPKI